MRKQTKLVAVLSAAALLAIGASMTSFAKGWTEENGEWVYLDSDGERVYQEWKKSGSNYYWLDEDGVMATNKIVEDDDDVYYVNEYGVRVKNQWVSTENEDGVDVNGEEVDTLWYYFGDNGKAYKADDNEFKKKTVAYAGGNGTFFFDADGHMASGWVDHTAGGTTDRYYCGTENEGWAYTSWQYLEPDDDIASSDYDDMEWFCFKSSGKMRKNTTYYYANRYWSLDANGVCLDDWFINEATTPTAASGADVYASSESGSVGTGWIYTDNKDETDTKWFYLVSITENGKTVRSVPFNSNAGDGLYRAKVIKSKTYVFDTDGQMIDGLLDIREDGVDAKYAEQGKKYALPEDTKGGAQSKGLAAGVYYFNENSGSVKGQMITGKTAVEDDGDVDYYYFDKSTGKALTATVKDGVVYGEDGKRIQAEDGNTNALVVLDYAIKDVNGKVVVAKDTQFIVSSSGKLRTSGSVKVDGIYYNVNKTTHEAVYDDVKNNK